MSPVILFFPTKRSSIGVIIKLVFQNEIDPENQFFVQIFDDENLVLNFFRSNLEGNQILSTNG